MDESEVRGQWKHNFWANFCACDHTAQTSQIYNSGDSDKTDTPIYLDVGTRLAGAFDHVDVVGLHLRRLFL